MTFDAQIQTVTQDYIVPKVTDQTINGNVLPLILLAQGKQWYGETYKIPVKLDNSDQGGAFNDTSEFKTEGVNVRRNASFDPRAYYQSVVIGGIARSVNAVSKTQLLNLVKVEMESAAQDMIDDIGSVFYGTGSDGLNFLGVDAAIDDGNTVPTYGGLSRATYTNWVSDIQTTVGAWDFSKARTLWNSASRGSRKPNIATADATTFGYVEADYTAIVDGNYSVLDANRKQLTPNGIMPSQGSSLTGSAGFEALYYSGTPIVKDEKEDTQTVRAMNTEFLGWRGVNAAEANPVSLKSMYHDGNDLDKAPSSTGFAWTGFVRPAKQYAWIGQFLLIGNVVCSAPNLQSKSTGVTS